VTKTDMIKLNWCLFSDVIFLLLNVFKQKKIDLCSPSFYETPIHYSNGTLHYI